ncbi:TPA: hypothetical protein N0F65_009104, partial [Lagenidium giganteum]
RFREVVSGWPSTAGDTRVFKNSNLGRTFDSLLSQVPPRPVLVGEHETIHLPAFLLGDSVYANSKYFVTTVDMNAISDDAVVRKLNRALLANPNAVEQTYEIKKSRFCVLMRPL